MEKNKILLSRIQRIRSKHSRRDRDALMVTYAKNGDFDKIAPGLFSEQYPRSIVANLIDTYSRHAAAALSGMPTFHCRTSSMGASDASKKRADLRSGIVRHYFFNSNVQLQMQQAAEQFYLFGLIVGQVVPDFDSKIPMIRLLDSNGFYPVWDWQGRTVEGFQVYRKHVTDLITLFPEIKQVFNEHRFRGDTVELVTHDDGKNITVLLSDLGGYVLHQTPNPVGRCLFHATMAPTVDGEIRGFLDQLIFPQIARIELQQLTMEAAGNAVEAPTILPMDISEVSLGPNSVMRTNNPQGARRLELNVPHESFAAIEHFKSEMQTGAITPQALSGSIDASVVTGSGIRELGAGYSQQVAMAQDTLKNFFTNVAELCFTMDEKLWSNVQKQISGYHKGNQYSLSYVPVKAIDGNYQVDVTYGTSTGLDKNRNLVYNLQLLGAGLLSKDTIVNELPGDIDAVTEIAKIQVEQSREAILSAVTGLSQSVPGIVAQGGDPSATIAQIVEFVNGLEKGKPLEEIASKVWPVQPPTPPEQPRPMGADGNPMVEDGMGVADPEAPLAAQGQGAMSSTGSGRMPLNSFFAGLTSNGNPNLGSYVTRMSAAR